MYIHQQFTPAVGTVRLCTFTICWVCSSCSLWFLSLITNEAEHLSYVYWTFGFSLCEVKSLSLLISIDVSSFFVYSGYKPFVSYVCCKPFSSVACFFILLVIFDEQKFLIVKKSNLSVFVISVFSVLCKKTFSSLRSRRYYCMLSSKALLFDFSYLSA